MTGYLKTLLGITSLIALSTAVSSGAQPVITRGNSVDVLIGSSASVSRHSAISMDGVAPLVGIAGPNQIWDLSTLTFGEPALESVYYMARDAGMPGARDPRLLNASLVIVSEPSHPTWTYQRLDDSGRSILGCVSLEDVTKDGRPDTLVTIFDPESTVMPFPLTAGTAWSDSSAQTLEFQGSPPVPVETVVSSHLVDGWGTLVTPAGTSPVLRIRTDARIVGVGGQHITRHLITFLTPVPDDETDGFTYDSGAEIAVDSLGIPIALSYSTHIVSRPTGIQPIDELATTLSIRQNYPNPFDRFTTIPFGVDTPGRARITVFDIMGRRATELLNRALPAGNHATVWHVGSMPSGMYRVVLELGNRTTSRMLVVQK